MKNGIIVCTVLAAVAVGGFLLSSGDQAAVTGTPGAEGSKLESSSGESSATQEIQKPVPSAKGPWPVAIVGETTYDFGRMQVGAELDHVFTIRNEGDGPLNLVTGRPTCKCTAFELSKSTLAKGEEAELTVRWKGKVRDQGFRHGGPVYTDDPKNQTLNFAVMGIVDSAVELLPTDVWDAGRITGDSEATMEASLISRVHPNFKITDITCESPFVETSVTEMADEAAQTHDALSGYSVSVAVSPEIPAGPFETEIQVSVDCLDDPLTVTLKASRVGPIQIQPPPGIIWVSSVNGLKLGQFSAADGQKAELIAIVDETNLDGDLKITGTKAVPGFIEAELTPLSKVDDNTGRYRLTITIPPGIPRMSRDRGKPAQLDLQTNHPDNPEVNISISFRAF